MLSLPRHSHVIFLDQEGVEAFCFRGYLQHWQHIGWRIPGRHWCRCCSCNRSNWCRSFWSSEHLNPFAASGLGFHPSPQVASRLWFLCSLRGYCVVRNRDKRRIDDLTTTGLEPLGAEVSLKQLEELLDHSRLAQSLSEEGNRGGIWNAVPHAKPDKLLKGASVIHLEFKLVNCKQKATPTLRFKSC